jgi:MYXO-CTERM domain-containing protein
MKTITTILLPLILAAGTAQATTTSVNYGSLGAVADGTNTDFVQLGQGSPLLAPGGDVSNGYSAGERTQVPFLAALNPSAASPFTIEFWAYPTSGDNDDAWVVNRHAAGNRSGWTFFQRAAGTGWNFRMYNGAAGALGWDLTGGTANHFQWSHVAVTWDGSAALLFVNGVLADDTNTAGLNGVYNPNSVLNSPTINLGSNFDGGSPINGLLDETAWYPSALPAGRILSHYTTATTSGTPGAYAAEVLADGASLYLPNAAPVPEPAVAGMLALGGLTLLRRRRA